MTFLEFVDKHITGIGWFAFASLAVVGFLGFFAVLTWADKPTIRK